MKPEQLKHLIFFLVILLILIVLWPKKSEKKKSYKKTVKENFIDETMRDDNGTFSLFNWNGNNEGDEENDKEEIIEHFPQTTPMNVIYTDTNGNLSNTSDLGLQNLTITGNGSLQLGSKFRLNANKDMWADDEWLRLSNPANTDYGGGFAAGKLWAQGDLSTNTLNVRSSGNVAGGLNVGGQVNTMGKTNYPKGWGGGVRTFDLYGSGTLGWGDDNANLSTTIGGGNIWTSGTGQFGNLGTYNSGDNASWDNQNGGLNSWWGIGFRNTLGKGAAAQGARAQSVEDHGGTSHVFDTRWGHTYMRGNMGADGNISAGGSVSANSIKIGSWVISENSDGHLVFSKNGAVLGTENQGHIRMAQDGNLWLSRSTGPGWVADNIGAIRGDIKDKYVKYDDNLYVYTAGGTNAGGALGVCGFCANGVGAVFGRNDGTGDAKVPVNFRKT